ncbi:MAG: PAS domain S-box protein, partial [Janthinobacterium lividum]
MSLERLRLLESVVVTANDGVLITKANPTAWPGPEIVYCNAAFTKLTGYTEADVLGRTPRLLQSPKTDRKALDILSLALSRWEPIEIELLNVRKDGSEFWIQLSIVAVANETGYFTHWVSVQRDISDRKLAEEEAARTRLIQAENLRLAAQVKQIEDAGRELAETHRLAQLGNWRLAMDNISMTWSSETYALLGLDAQLFAPTVENLLSVIRSSDRAVVKQVFDTVFQTRIAQQVEFAIANASQQLRYVRIEARPAFGVEGDLLGLFGFCQDITQSKTAELGRLRAERLSMLGQLTGGVAHDFNNLLTVTLLNLEEAIESVPSHDVLQDLLKPALHATMRGAELTSRLLAYARRTPLRPDRIDLPRFFGELSTLLQRSIGEQYHLDLRLSSSAEGLVADPGQLENAIMNLAINARDAMPGGGCVTITAASRNIDTFMFGVEGEIQPGCYIVIEVKDEGEGIPPELISRVTEPFFTTKTTSSGSGLGLSMVYGFAHQSGGYIGITSILGEGTIVSIYLPLPV